MAINKSKIKIKDEVGRTVNVEFSYDEDVKTYNGVLTIMSNNIGGIPIDDYEVDWEDEQPKNYDPKVDDEKIYHAYLSKN